MEINSLREKINQIDSDLLELLNNRMQVVQEIGLMKKKTNAIVYRPEREKWILDRLETLNKDPLLNREAIEAIFLEIFAVSRNIELPERISYLGPEGSFTHQAAESRFGALSEYMALPTIKAIFDSIETERVRFGIVPIENNQEGSVADTIDQLCVRDVKIAAEIPMPIHFAFASNENNLHNIETIFSKDIAFRQCRNFIEDHFGNEVKCIEVTSTSKAARLAKERPNSAAICSHIAAKLYDLPVFFKNIEDTHNNRTRFLILGKNIVNQPGENDKTTILARISDTPGALVDFLFEFKNAGVNLTKVESRPAKEGDKFKYWFLIDFDGHYFDPKVESIFKKYPEQIHFLGSYVKLC